MLKKTALVVAISLFLIPAAITTADESSSDTYKTNESLQNNSEEPTVILFYSPTCPHCEEVEKHIEKKTKRNLVIRSIKQVITLKNSRNILKIILYPQDTQDLFQQFSSGKSLR